RASSSPACCSRRSRNCKRRPAPAGSLGRLRGGSENRRHTLRPLVGAGTETELNSSVAGFYPPTCITSTEEAQIGSFGYLLFMSFFASKQAYSSDLFLNRCR